MIVRLFVMMKDNLLATGRGSVEYFSRQLVLQMASRWATVYCNDEASKPGTIIACRMLLEAADFWFERAFREVRLRQHSQPLGFRFADVTAFKPDLALKIT